MFGDRARGHMQGTWTFSADGTKVIGLEDQAIRVTDVHVFNSATLATHATNYVTFKLINMGTDASGTTVVATASTSQTGGSAMAAAVAFPLTVTAAASKVSSKNVLGLIYDENNTSVADSQEITVVVHYVYEGAAS